ncbi:MAG: GxxExxY protein [Prevotella sp.]|nr:GxxExxY protein [Prevotella sp.]
MSEVSTSSKLLFSQETHEVIGAAMAVHRYFGNGFTEKVYQDAFEVELKKRNIPFRRESELHAVYEGMVLPAIFKPDFICYDKIIVELKAVKELEDLHRSQAINYGKVAECPVSLLINFGESSLKFERYILKR